MTRNSVSLRNLTLTCNFIKKEALVWVFSCEFYEISKNTFLQRTPLVAASVFWDKYDSDMKLLMYQTFQVQRKIEEIAQEIGGSKVLARLSAGNMIDMEIKYHCKCLVTCYNKVRNEQAASDMQQENDITVRIKFSPKAK